MKTRTRQINKVLNPGTVEEGNVFIHVEFKDGKLSISGVEGPMGNGNARGSWGQIAMGYAHRNPKDNDQRYSEPKRIKKFADGWNESLWFDLLDIWNQWHLNDMTAGCEHQTGPDWESKDIEVYHFRLRKDVEERRRQARKEAEAAIKTGATFAPTEQQVKEANLPDRITFHQAELIEDAAAYYEPNGPQYQNDHYNRPVETKRSNWVRADEHKDGLLCKPCPVCGYKYGTAWRLREVPDSVLDALEAMPATKIQPAWV